MAGQAISDPAKYKTEVLRSIDQFNQAVEHFRKVGHRWPISAIQGGRLTLLKDMDTYEQFERWLLSTQVEYDRNTFDRLPAQM